MVEDSRRDGFEMAEIAAAGRKDGAGESTARRIGAPPSGKRCRPGSAWAVHRPAAFQTASGRDIVARRHGRGVPGKAIRRLRHLRQLHVSRVPAEYRTRFSAHVTEIRNRPVREVESHQCTEVRTRLRPEAWGRDAVPEDGKPPFKVAASLGPRPKEKERVVPTGNRYTSLPTASADPSRSTQRASYAIGRQASPLHNFRTLAPMPLVPKENSPILPMDGALEYYAGSLGAGDPAPRADRAVINEISRMVSGLDGAGRRLSRAGNVVLIRGRAGGKGYVGCQRGRRSPGMPIPLSRHGTPLAY